MKPGYANNYLFAKNLAVPANDENMKKLNDEIAAQKALEAQIKQDAEDVKKHINGKSIKLSATGGPDGKLYGAITAKDIAEKLEAELQVEVDKRKVVTDNIKTTGTYTVKVKLHAEVEAEIYVIVTVK